MFRFGPLLCLLLRLGQVCSGAISSYFSAERLQRGLAYSALVTMYLAYLGAAGVVYGMLLWPAIVLHAILAAVLVRDFSKTHAGKFLV